MSGEKLFKARIVQLIFSKKTEEALKALSQHFNVEIPKLKVGMPKRHSKNLGCYTAKDKTIHVSKGENLYNAYLILHEFYHHLRTRDREHKGTERYADEFAKEFIQVYRNQVLGLKSKDI